MEEIWKDIANCENYQISNLGNIKNKKTERILKCSLNMYGYKQTSLYNNHKRNTVKNHRLVAQAFISNPNNYPCINHINGIKTDNRIENLEWCTYKYNNIEAVKIGLRNDVKKVNQYDLQGNFIRTWESLGEVMRNLKINISNISNCCKGKRKSAGGYIWKFI